MGTHLSLPQRGTAPQFWAHICCGKMAGLIKMPLGMRYGGRIRTRRLCVKWGPSSSPKKGHSPPPIFGPCLLWTNGCMHQDTTWYGGRPQPRRFVLDGDSAPHVKGTAAPFTFGPCLLWPNGWMGQDTTWYGRRPRPRRCVRWGPSPLHFWSMSIVAKLLSSLFIYCW